MMSLCFCCWYFARNDKNKEDQSNIFKIVLCLKVQEVGVVCHGNADMLTWNLARKILQEE